MNSETHTHRNDTWSCPDNEEWFTDTLREMDRLVGTCTSLRFHSYVALDEHYIKTTEVNYIKLQLARSAQKSTAIRDWFLDLLRLERTELMGHEIQSILTLTTEICTALTLAKEANANLGNRKHVSETSPDLLIITPADKQLFHDAHEHAIYVFKEFMDHEGYDCPRKDEFTHA